MGFKIKGGSFIFSKEVKAKDASFKNYFKWLSSQNDHELFWPYHIKYAKKTDETRQLYMFVNDDYWYGVVLSGKNKQFQHVKRKKDGKIIIEAVTIDGEPPVELNFFCIRQDSGKGIYSHYLGSYPFHAFIKDLWGSYREFVLRQKKKALSTRKFPKSQINKLYSLAGRCQYGPLYSPEEFEKLLNKLAHIEEVRFTTYEIDNEEDEPVGELFSSKREIYKFKSEKLVTKKIRDWIISQRQKAKKILKDNRIKYTGTIYGYDSSDQPISIDFDKTMQNFLEYDYDKLGTIEVDNLLNHDIIQKMIIRLKNDPIFNKTK